MFKSARETNKDMVRLCEGCMLAALVASIHKTEPPGDQVLEVLVTCCLPQLLGQTAAVEKKIRIKSSQVNGTETGFSLGKALFNPFVQPQMRIAITKLHV